MKMKKNLGIEPKEKVYYQRKFIFNVLNLCFQNGLEG